MRKSSFWQLLVAGLVSFPLISLAQSEVDRADFSLEESRQFTSYDDSSSTIKMSLAQVPDEFECPLFSNSPYTDILAALDGLQTSINLFPKCSESDKTGDLMSSSSVELRQKIIEAQSLQEKGETRRLGISAEQILSSATKLQDLIGQVSSQGNCYKTDESKNLIFSINDTFQSIAPLALDFAAKNPSLGPILSRYLPAVAGARAVSKGISVLEMALKHVPTLNMKDPDNRVAVIKNTCSFMKLYNKVEYITLDRASRLRKINRDFDTKINASREMKRSVIESLGEMTLSTNPTDAEIIQIKDRIEKFQSILSKASDELISEDGKSSDIGICTAIKTVHARNASSGLLTDVVRLAELLQKSEQIDFKKTKLQEYEKQINVKGVLQDSTSCAQIGQEWLMAQKEVLAEGKLLIAGYDNSTEETLSNESAAKVKISREDKKTANLQADKAKLNIFADLSVFEPGELEKRMRGMPKYLFNGTDGGWFQKLKKNGPVYDLLYDNEESFEYALKRFKTSVNYLLNFEYRQALLTAKKEFPMPAQYSTVALERYQKEGMRFRYVTTATAPVGSYEHRELCNHSKLAIKAYVEATDQLLSSEYLCKMIEPVLKEQEVSMWLRRYCQDSKSLVGSSIVRAGFKELARPLFVKNGPKRQIESIMRRYDKLECN